MAISSLAAGSLSTQITYVLPSSRINRRFWAPGEEHNTGVYAPYDVTIRNARLADEDITLDTHGFALRHHATDITDWPANYGPDGAYAKQVVAVAKAMSGADFVVPMGGMVRSSGLTGALVQPPAGEAHVDFTTKSATMIAERLYRAARPDGAGYDRFLCFSLWRALSPPPQDMPLALYDGRSVRDDEGTPNTKVDVDATPTGDALFADIPGEDDMVPRRSFITRPTIAGGISST